MNAADIELIREQLHARRLWILGLWGVGDSDLDAALRPVDEALAALDRMTPDDQTTRGTEAA